MKNIIILIAFLSTNCGENPETFTANDEGGSEYPGSEYPGSEYPYTTDTELEELEELPTDTELEELPTDTELEELPTDTELEELPTDTELEELHDTELEELHDTELEQLPDTELEQLPDTELEEFPDTELEQLPDTELEQLPTDTELEELPTDTDTGPESVCDMSGEGCFEFQRCDVETLFICPLLEVGVSISAGSYGVQWLICQSDGHDWHCPTNGYHRPCVELKGVIGLRCIS